MNSCDHFQHDIALNMSVLLHWFGGQNRHYTTVLGIKALNLFCQRRVTREVM